MKQKVTQKTLKTLLRIVICLTLVLSSVLSPLAAGEIYADQKNLGMKWTRVYSRDGLRKACELDKYQENDPNSANFWKPVLVAYKSGNNYYYLQGAFSYHEKKCGSATRVTKISGIHVGEESFITRNNASLLQIKIHDTIAEEIMFRVANADNSLQNYWMNVNIEWWGVKWHAIHHVNINGEGDPYKGFEYWSATSHDTDPWFDLVDGDDGKFRIRWMSQHGGCTDRTWEYSGSSIDYAVGNSKNYQFYIYIGEPCGINYQEVNLELDKYQSQCMQDYTIASNVELYVPEGATLIMMGQNHNNGHILVDGGTLVVRGSLDADAGGSGGNQGHGSFNPSDIDIINGGTLIIERDGSLMHRNKSSGVTLSGNSSAYIKGTMMVASTFNVGDGCSVEAIPGSLIAIGVRPDDDHDYENLIPSALKENINTYMDEIIAWDVNTSLVPGFNYRVNFGPSDSTAGLWLLENSSFVSYGAVFIYEGYAFHKDNSCYMDAKVSRNHYASIGSMMRQWE